MHTYLSRALLAVGAFTKFFGHKMVKRYLVPVIAGVLVLTVPALWVSTASANIDWIDGAYESTTTINCSMLGQPIHEEGTRAWVSYYGELNPGGLNSASPIVNEPYSLKVRLEQKGNACVIAGSWSKVEIFLPPNTTFAFSPSAPVQCWYKKPQDLYLTLVNPCPAQNLVPTSSGGFAFLSPVSGNNGLWPLAKGAWWEFRFPVQSGAQPAGSLAYFTSRIEVNDGSSPAPVLSVNVGVPVTAPSIAYPTPSTADIEFRTARTLAILGNHNIGGTVYWDIGKDTAYGLHVSQPFNIEPKWDTYPNLYSEWKGLQPGTLYHWRLRFVAANGITFTGSDQQFTTRIERTRDISLICRLRTWFTRKEDCD